MGKALFAVFILLILAAGIFAGYFIKSGETATLTKTLTSISVKTVPTVSVTTSTFTATNLLEKTLTEVSTVTIEKALTERVTVTTTLTEAKTVNEVSAICFPKLMGGCESLLIDLIEKANKSIHVMIYSFTLDDLADALIEAHQRGVDVKILVETENAYSRGSEIERLAEAGVQVALDSNPYLMHNKVMIVDGKIVVTGSYNWSWSAENRNDENLIIIVSERVAEAYENDFNGLWSSAEKL